MKKALPLLVLSAIGCNLTGPSPLKLDNHSQVWLAPNIGSRDFVDMFKKPAEWSETRSRVDVFQFYHGNLLDTCPICGQNNFRAFVDAVPGGAFRWLNNEGIEIAIEAGAVKLHNCQMLPDDSIRSTVDVVRRVQTTGAVVGYISIDEPYTGAVDCGMPRSISEVSTQAKYYIDGVYRRFPNIKIGLIEAYPFWSANQIKEMVNELENQRIYLSFFHLDMHRRGGLAWNNIPGDLTDLARFFKDKNIPFGVIIWGDDGSSNQAFMADAINTASLVSSALTPDSIIVQSWSYPPNDYGTRFYPDNIPENQPMTLTWLFKEVLGIFRLN